MKYLVPIIYNGLSNFIVEADSPEEASEKARNLFGEGESEVSCGNEYENIDHVGEIEVISQ